MNWSAASVALVPTALTTVTSTAPADAEAGTVADSVLAFTTEKVAITVPNLTALTLVTFAPEIVTDVPPRTEPLEGDRLVTLGRPAVV